jgi:hypothetical protein
LLFLWSFGSQGPTALMTCVGVEARAPYEILMPDAIIQYRIFAAFGARRRPNRRGGVQEVAVLENSLGARVGARASARGANFDLPSPRDVVHIMLAIVALGAAVVLFFGWLMVSNPSRPAMLGSRIESDCTSLGRGGVYCAKHSMADGPANLGSSPEDQCASLGKGGRICAEHP